MFTKLSIGILLSFYSFYSFAQFGSNERAFCSMLEEDFHKIKVKCAGMANEQSCRETNALESFRIHKKSWLNRLTPEYVNNAAKNYGTTADKILTTMFVNFNDKCEANGFSSLNILAFEDDFSKSIYLSYNGYVKSPSSDNNETSNRSNEPKKLRPNNEWINLRYGFEVNRVTGANRFWSSLPLCQGSDVTKWSNCWETYIFASGNKYEGEWKDGRRNGRGIFYSLADNKFNGDKYVGWWQDGEKHGNGIYTRANGTVLDGIFENGQFISKK